MLASSTATFKKKQFHRTCTCPSPRSAPVRLAALSATVAWPVYPKTPLPPPCFYKRALSVFTSWDPASSWFIIQPSRKKSYVFRLCGKYWSADRHIMGTGCQKSLVLHVFDIGIQQVPNTFPMIGMVTSSSCLHNCCAPGF